MSAPTFAYVSQNTFLKSVAQVSTRPYAIVGVPWDGAVTNRSGARMGPDAIRRASHMLCDGIHPHFNVSPRDHLTDLGDLALPNTGLDAMRAAMREPVATIISHQHACFLGGDHSITLAVLRAYRKHLDAALALIHFDAHCDTWTDHFGEPSGHGTWAYEAIKEGLVIPAGVVQIGVRSAGSREAREYVSDMGGRVYTARELRGRESVAELALVVDEIKARMVSLGSPPVYLTLDIDCLDPAFAPGTGTPEPGGMSSVQVMTLLEELSPLPFIGMDCCEVSPPYDHAEITSNAAATLVWTYLAGRIAHGATLKTS